MVKRAEQHAKYKALAKEAGLKADELLKNLNVSLQEFNPQKNDPTLETISKQW